MVRSAITSRARSNGPRNETMDKQKILGAPIKRNEDPRFLGGGAKFTADISLPGMLHMAILRSELAHAGNRQHRHQRGSGDAGRRSGTHRGRPGRENDANALRLDPRRRRKPLPVASLRRPRRGQRARQGSGALHRRSGGGSGSRNAAIRPTTRSRPSRCSTSRCRSWSTPKKP